MTSPTLVGWRWVPAGLDRGGDSSFRERRGVVDLFVENREELFEIHRANASFVIHPDMVAWSERDLSHGMNLQIDKDSPW